MREALIAYLLADIGVSARAGARIHWGARTQGEALPGIVIYRKGGRRDVNYDGVNGLVESRVQIDCLGSTFTSASALSRSVVDALKVMRGVYSNRQFQGVFINNEFDDFEGESPDRIYRTSVDVTLWHDE